MHLIGIPLTGTSVNPARSLGPALFAGGEPLAHVWLFLLAPLVGAALAVLVVRALAPPALTVEQARRPPAAGRDGCADARGAERRGGAAPASARRRPMPTTESAAAARSPS